ncbi:ABC transporter permease [Hoeflea sp. YIM 152468]|uniref:ABC transporter permease n=1 Tax=Hoeflea sp. YIM 152468 TaxID=3031759 RepID=UPI0023DC7F79|nr:ABC transporter permease [Hoeflea sp. YIM 152468]MDF1610437.1 ABC transporter permease [Hoeflea sp. YIM 152468]
MTGDMRLARLAPPLTLAILLGPLFFGLAGTALPAFGYLPELGGEKFTTQHFSALAAVPGILRSSVLSILIGLVTTLVSLGTVAAFVASDLGTAGFARVRRMISPLLSVPHAAAAFGLAFMIAPSGMIMRLISPWATGLDRPPDLLIVNDPMALSMMAGLIVKEIPFLFLVTLSALPQTRHMETMRLGRSLGYGRIASFTYLLWPPLYRQIRLAVFAVVAYASSVVDVALILGPHLPPTLPVRLITWMNDPDLSIRFLASAGAVAQLGVTLTALLGWVGLERLGALLVCNSRSAGRRLRRDTVLRHGARAVMIASAAVVFGGIAMLAVWSVSGLWQFPDALPSSFSLRSWTQALPRMSGPLQTTLAVAGLSTLIALVLTILCLEREYETGRGRGGGALLLIYLPLIVPQISFMFGLQVLSIWLGVDASFSALVLAHLVFVLPYVFLSLSDPWRAHDRRHDLIAAGLGMSRTRTLVRIRLPMLTRAILTAAAVGFSVSVGQYLPTVLIGAGRLTTVTTEAVALAAGGNRRAIGVYAFMQTLLPFFAFSVATGLPGLLFRNRRGLRV